MHIMKGHICEKPPGSGNWYAVIDTRDPANGKRKRKWHTLEASGKRHAQIECATLISSIGGGTYMEPNKTTMAQFLDRWLDHIKTQVSPRSFERYAEIALKNLVPLIGGVVVAKLKPVEISVAYAKALKEGRRDRKGGLSPRSVHHMHRILKQSLGQAVKWQMLTRNAADAVDPPKVERQTLNTYDMGQTVTLLKCIKDTRLFIPTLLAVLCGLRRGEVV